jgi:BMFP domain-containing protein YqiC
MLPSGWSAPLPPLDDRKSTHHRINADRQRADVHRRIEAAIASMRSDLESRMRGGEKSAPWRVSRNEVLRRAGKIDKNTLKRPYHKDLKCKVDAFLKEAAALQTLRSEKLNTIESEQPSLNHYAQMLAAAQITRDSARQEAEALRRKVAELEAEIANLRLVATHFQAGISNVLSIRKRNDG